MNKKAKILVMQSENSLRHFFDENIIKQLSGEFDVTFNPEHELELSQSMLRELIGNVDGIITGWGGAPIGADAYSHASNLKIVSLMGSSIKSVSPEVGWKNNIVYTNTASSIGLSVAEFSLALILLVLNRLKEYNNTAMQSQRWGWDVGYTRHELANKTVGLIGMGFVAKTLASFLKPFNVNLKVYDPYISDSILEKYDAQRCQKLEELIIGSDIISVHVGLTPETRHMLNKDNLSLIKDGGILVNTSRGKVINEDDLTNELNKGRFFAALDVFEEEPLSIKSPLRNLKNVFLTPHVAGGLSPDVHRRNALTIMNDLVRFFNGETPKNIVTREMYNLMT